jgi:hypothetical protein
MTDTVAPRPDTVKGGNKRWNWIRHEGVRYWDLGRNPDGTLHNPNGYPEEVVLAAIEGAEERRHRTRSNAAKKAAKTRQERKDRLVYQVVERLKAGGKLVPGTHCEICGRALGRVPWIMGRGRAARC